MIVGKKISKSYTSSGTRIDILGDLDFQLSRGETLGIVGASGIGKSTLLHIMGTLDRPTDGQLLFNDEDVFSFDDEKLAKFRNRSIGFVFQFHHLLPEFTALENTMMPALISGVKKKIAMESAEQILLRVGLKDRLEHKATELSGGEQQRVALARALVLKPSLLLADEPTGNLDKHTSDQVHELIFELNTELNMTMVVVTHNMELASVMARRVTIMDGKLVDLS